MLRGETYKISINSQEGEVNVAELFYLMKEKSNALKLPFRGIELRDNYTFHEIQFFCTNGHEWEGFNREY